MNTPILHHYKKVLFIVACFISTISLSAQQLPYQNPALSSDERAKDLIYRLSLKEKADLMVDVSYPISRLGIKKFFWWSEALHGLGNTTNVTVFPEPIGMAASFNDALLYKVFDVVSDETRAKNNELKQKGGSAKRFLSLSVWTPNVNIFRDPRWGRGQETYGEDPYLTSRMGVAVVKGLQGPDNVKYKKLLACAKHFAVHSGPEWSRHTLNLTDLNPRDLNETYFPAFKSLVQDADVREVMCAYQSIDGQPCCGNTHLLQDILRDEWGFKYLVVSDCGAISDFYQTHKVSPDATHAAAKGVKAGNDLECGSGAGYTYLPEAVEKGLVTEKEIDTRLQRVLVGRFDLGEMDPDSLVSWTKIPASVLNCNAHKQLALDMARQTMTLLLNKKNALPLSKSAQKIAVIGPNADEKTVMWGNYNSTPNNTVTILDGIKTKLSAQSVLYDKGCDLTENLITESMLDQCSFAGKPGIKATYWNNRDFKGDIVATEQITNPIKLSTTGQHEFSTGVQLENFSGRYESTFKPLQSDEIVFNTEVCGAFQLIVNGDTLANYNSGKPLAKKITLKVTQGKEYKIEAYFKQVGNWSASLNLNLGKEIPVKFNDLIYKLKGIDLVVFAGGISSKLEGEEMPVNIPGFKNGDRTDIQLPEVQRNCLKALKQAGKKVIFVNCSGSAIGLVPETENCDAILQAWYGGELGGQAVADVLFGDYNPSGKLPISFYKDIKKMADFEDYSMKGRTYRFMSDPLYPFGFGLSYTKFDIGTAKFNKTTIKADETINLTVPVTNSGKRTGTEVIQVYINKVNDVDGPIKTMRGFQRVELSAGKTGQVSLDLAPSAFEFFDWKQRKMMVSPGEYIVYYGSSSDKKDLKTSKIIIL